MSSADYAQCKLCGRYTALMTSHIVPSFVGDWLKRTSATGFLRRASEPNRRVQDLPKVTMLCKDCEGTLSKFENYFANNIFRPFQTGRSKTFRYDESLTKFAVSLSWRVLAFRIETFEAECLELGKCARQAYDIWRDYLLDKRPDSGEYTNHLFFMDRLAEDGSNIRNFGLYALRSVDAEIARGREEVYVYTKIPAMIIVSAIKPTDLKGWIGTKISTTGEIGPPQKIENRDWGQFIKSRIEMAFERKVSEEQKRVIKDKLLRDPDRVLKSESLQVVISEERRRRHECLLSCTEFIQWLVSRLSEVTSDDILTRLSSYEIVDTLIDLGDDDARRLEKEIMEVAQKACSTETDSCAEVVFGEVVITFCFCMDPGRKHDLAQEKLSKWEDKTFRSDIKKVLVIVTDSPKEQFSSFVAGWLNTRNEV